MSNDLLTTGQVARILGLTAPTIISYTRANQLKAILVNRQWRYRYADLEAFINDREKRGR